MTDNKSKKKIKVLILCAGESTRWGNYLGLPKQLISFNGEPLLKRTVRLLNDQRCYDIMIISHNEQLQLSNCGFFKPPKHRWTVETLLSTYPLWSERTIILLGDVSFMEKAISKITNTVEGIHVYGRPGPSRYTFKIHGEIFAISFNKKNWDQIVANAETAICNAEKGGRGKLWQLYRSLAGYPLKRHRIEKEIFTPIHDLTDDIDDPKEYKKLVKMLTCATSTNRYKRILILYNWLILGLTDSRPYLKNCFKYYIEKPFKRSKLKAFLDTLNSINQSNVS